MTYHTYTYTYVYVYIRIRIGKETLFSWLSGITFRLVIAIGLLMERHPDPDLTVGSMDAMKDKTRE